MKFSIYVFRSGWGRIISTGEIKTACKKLSHSLERLAIHCGCTVLVHWFPNTWFHVCRAEERRLGTHPEKLGWRRLKES